MDGSIRIVALKNNEPVGAWEFEKESITIGRSKTADVRLDDAAISRVHCIVDVRPNGVFVKDCGSRNGIWVAGRRVEEALLSSRDEVVVEHYRIKAYMVWGNTVANRFSDKSEEKTRVPGASKFSPPAPMQAELARDTARPTAPPAKSARAVEPVKPSLAPTAVPVKASRPVVAKKAPSAPALEDTNALPVAAKPVARGTVSAEMDEILADARPSKPAPRAPAPVAAKPAPRVEVKAEPKAPKAEPVRAAKPVIKDAPKKAAINPSLPAFYFDSDEDDDDEEEITLPPAFSMIETLASSRTRKPAEGKAVIEVVRYRGDNVLDVTRVDRGGRYDLPFTGSTLVQFGGDEARLNVDGFSAELRTARGSKEIQGEAALRFGEVADLMGDDGVGYMIRFTEPMAPSRNSPMFAAAAAAAMVGCTGASLTLHAMFGIAMVAADMMKPEAEPEWSDFAKVDMEPEPEQLAVAPTPTPVPAKPEPTPPPVKQKAPEKLAKKPVQQNQKVGGADRTEAKVASAGVLGGLGKMDIKIDSKSPALAAVTNLDAIKSTGGKSGGFRVSALTGKVPGDVAMGRAGRANGTVDISTISGKDIAGSALGGFGGTAKKGGGKVKGVVTKVPTQNVGVQGSLDRAQIAAVVNKHIAEIRHCYEKNLINDPGLSGKIQEEWTINPDGTVGAVKTKFTSMKGGDVAGCIASRIRTWQFPRPKGNGYVIVNYPFMFDSVGF